MWINIFAIQKSVYRNRHTSYTCGSWQRQSAISMFDESDKRNIREPQQDRLVISLPVGNYLIKGILVDNRSSINIMMLGTLTHMGLAESDMIKKSTKLVGFSGETKRILGEITLPMYVQGVNLLEKFCIIDVDSSYNIIMGRS
ncbi:uncharacterized protein LOC141673760 [Apium graveolens]|uniref:uncharacterized protein LOC141673760 n=1 Tax=Apium graveolens TaxID=4045 RepID=UPI003D7B67B0